MEEIRNKTDFIEESKEILKNIPEHEYLKPHQARVLKYIQTYPVKGLLIYHKMGMGKSLLSLALAIEFLKKGDKIVFISAKTLHENFKKTIDQYEALSKHHFAGKLAFVSLNASNMFEQFNRATISDLETYLLKKDRKKKNTAKLDGKIIIMDEAHNFFNAITNGSTNAQKLYQILKENQNCKILFLTGSPVVNHPFELVPCFNILAGKEILPEAFNEFNEYFIDGSLIKNRDKFSNRIYGLVSYVSAANSKDLPEQLPIKFVECEMSEYQYSLYSQARNVEIETQTANRGFAKKENKLEKSRTTSASYRVVSREFSNIVYPQEAIDKVKNEKNQTIYKPIFERLDFEVVNKQLPLLSPKIDELLKNALSYEGAGIIYSQFLDFGLRIIENLLLLRGFVKWTPLSSSLSSPSAKEAKKETKETENKVFACITGEIDKKEVNQMLEANKRGEIKLFLISSAGSEGVDFVGIRHVHILEVFWNWARIAQVIARAVRLGSHLHLPEKERKVQPFIYIASHLKELTTDKYLLMKAKRNMELINSFLIEVQNASIEGSKICKTKNKELFTDNIDSDINGPDPCDNQIEAEVYEENGEFYAKKNGIIYKMRKDGKFVKIV